MAKMIRVKMNNTESGRHADFGDNGQFHCLSGHEYDVPTDLGLAWIDQEIASEVKKPEPPKPPTTEA